MTTHDTPEAVPRYTGRGATGDAEKDDLRATRLELLDFIAEQEAALRSLWAWAVRTGPFIEAVLVLAGDKTPGLALLADIPALRVKVLGVLGERP